MIRIIEIVVILYLSCRSICDGKLATELLKNPELEVTTFTGNWACNGGCTLESSREHYSGYHSMKVSNR